ncbi:Protein CNGC15b [Trifolium repens]|nr:Protein CNGC15b [Trifolium repens]
MENKYLLEYCQEYSQKITREVFGRGELVIDSSKIATRYLHKGFFLDFIAALPLPQVLIWIIIPNLGETAWAGAAYNLMLYMLASHVLGACWYLLSIERQEACWKSVCKMEESSCKYDFFDCNMVKDSVRASWFITSNVTNLCSPNGHFYQFGIYGDAVTSKVTTSAFFNKYFFCLWWGLRNLSSLGQSLLTSTFVGEIMFAIVIATLGLVLFGLLIGNMQTYLQSTTARSKSSII